MYFLRNLTHLCRAIAAKLRLVLDVVGIFFLWICLHYAASHLYTNFCVPLTCIGFIISPFVVPTPHCQAFRWMISNGSSHITAMWMTFGTWWIKYLFNGTHAHARARADEDDDARTLPLPPSDTKKISLRGLKKPRGAARPAGDHLPAPAPAPAPAPYTAPPHCTTYSYFQNRYLDNARDFSPRHPTEHEDGGDDHDRDDDDDDRDDDSMNCQDDDDDDDDETASRRSE